MNEEWGEMAGRLPGRVIQDQDPQEVEEIYSVRKNGDDTWGVFVLRVVTDHLTHGHDIAEVATCGSSEELHEEIYALTGRELSRDDRYALGVDSLEEIFWEKAMTRLPGTYLGHVSFANMAGFSWEIHHSIRQTASGMWTLYSCSAPFHEESETEDKIYAEPEVEEEGSYSIAEIGDAVKERGYDEEFAEELVKQIKDGGDRLSIEPHRPSDYIPC